MTLDAASAAGEAAPAMIVPPARVTATFAPVAPFDFDKALTYLRLSPSAVVERVLDDAYVRPVRIEGRWVGLRVRSNGTTEQPLLAVDLLGAAADESLLPAAVALARRIFTTDDDLSGLDTVAAADPVFGAQVARVRGLRPVLIPDPFEALVWAIIGQQINIVFAAKLKRALVAGFGGTLDADGLALPLFPTPEVLANLEHERDLLPIQFSRQKSRYTIELARAVVNGEIDLEAVGRLPAEEAIAALVQLPGIGRWTAEYALMRTYGQRDIMPAGDGGLKQIVGREYGYGRLATEAEVRAHGEAWAGWRGYAAFYWWYQLQYEAAQRRELAAIRERERAANPRAASRRRSVQPGDTAAG